MDDARFVILFVRVRALDATTEFKRSKLIQWPNPSV